MMHYNVKLTNLQKQSTDCLVVGIFSDSILAGAAKKLDMDSGGYLGRLLQQGDLGDEVGQTLLLPNVPQLVTQRLLLVQCGKESDFSEAIFRKVLFRATQALKQTAVKEAINTLTELPVKNRDIHWKTRQAIAITADVLYVFDRFKSQKKPFPLRQLTFQVSTTKELKKAQKALKEAQAIAAGVTLTKDLGNNPANVCTPTYLAQQAQQLAKNYKTIKTTVHDEKFIKKLGMNAFLAVTQGSHEPAKLIVLEYQGTSKNK